MRIRTAKQRAERIDLNYFKHAHGQKRLRILLSFAIPAAALLWIAALAAGGSRAAYSAGPVSRAHAFAEMRCEICHVTASGTAGFRAHATDATCVSCHDAPAHAAGQTAEPACATCHQEHRGRVELARMDDRACVTCHGDLKTATGAPHVARTVGSFPAGHPEFSARQPGARDPGRLRFNHVFHVSDKIRGPNGPEKLECATCHKPEVGRAGTRLRGPATTGLMTPVSYAENCARCHPLFFDERIVQPAPHVKPEAVRSFVQQALAAYVRDHADEAMKPDASFRRVPLNFSRPPEPPAGNAAEWVTRRAAADERLLWNKTCVECHERETTAPAGDGLPSYAASNITKRWMPRAAFDHTPHLMVTCASCHAAEASSETADVLVPNQAVCATCHSPDKGAESRCFECHQYHDWKKSRAIVPSHALTDFK